MKRSCGQHGLLFALILTASAFPQAVTVSIDTGTAYQTIDGLGAMYDPPEQYLRDGPFYVKAPYEPMWDTLVYGYGASLFRMEVSPEIFPSLGAAYNYSSAIDGNGETVARYIRHFKALVARGVNRFIATPWTPPCWMKDNNACTQGGRLRAERFEDYTSFLRDFCRMFKDSIGVELYAITIQNEPQFPEPYNSCIMDEPTIVTLMTSLAGKLESAGLTTKIFGPEHMMWDKLATYGDVVTNPATKLYAFSIHGYYDGLAVDQGNAADWEQLYGLVNAHGKKLWMTETGGSGTVIDEAKRLHSALRSGKISAWSWWGLRMGQIVEADLSLTPSGRASSHYYRHIRPGFKMIASTSSSSGVWSTAYRSAQGDVVTAVIVNTGPSTTMALRGSGLPSTVTAFQSSASQNSVSLGAMSATATINLSSNSVTTITNHVLGPSSAISRPALRAAGVRPSSAHFALVSLDGRIVDRDMGRSFSGSGRAALDGRVAPGAYVVAGRSGSGSLVGTGSKAVCR